MLVGQVDGDPEAEMTGRERQRRDQQQGVVDRDLHRIAQGGIRRAAEDVVNAQHVGQEQPVEEPAFERAGERHPGLQRVIGVRPVARVAPQTGRLVRHAVHLESIEADLLGHGLRTLPNDGCDRGERSGCGAIITTKSIMKAQESCARRRLRPGFGSAPGRGRG